MIKTMHRTAPAFCEGTVMHARLAQVEHRFHYPACFVRIPLSQWDTLAVPLLGIDRFNALSLRCRDYGARDGSALLPWIRQQLAEYDLANTCDGEVVLQTIPRVFGHVFNPVNFWFCHDANGGLRAVLAEVNNTFGEHHRYLLAHPDAAVITAQDELIARKSFHVSPFLPVRGEYRFRFASSPQHHSASIDLWDDGQCQLRTRLSARALPLTGRTLGMGLLRFPLMSLGVLARIHWQAVRLFVKRVQFHRKPSPPAQETSR